MIKTDENTHITIIGMGRLMEALLPCYRTLAQTDARLRENVRAVTMDSRDLAGKNARLGFPVTLGDNLAALHENAPGLILFAPPPKAAEELCETVLAPYMAQLRERGGALPAVLAFPPSPDADYYCQALGAGVPIVSAVPCLGGEDGGSVLVTYPSAQAWTEDERAAVARFFSPVAKTVTLAPGALYDLLGSMCLYPLVYTVLFGVAAALDGGDCTAFPRELLLPVAESFAAGETDAASADADMSASLAACADAWARGIYAYQAKAGLATSYGAVREELLGYLKAGADMSAEALFAQHRGFATPGGIAELLVMEYNKKTRQDIAKIAPLGAVKLAQYIEGEAARLCAVASARASRVHIPLIGKDAAFTEDDAACFIMAIPKEAASCLDAKDKGDPASLYAAAREALTRLMGAEEAEAALWEARMELGAARTQAAALMLLQK